VEKISKGFLRQMNAMAEGICRAIETEAERAFQELHGHERPDMTMKRVWKDAYIVRSMSLEIERLRTLLGTLHEYFEDRQDAQCINGRYVPNKAMEIASEIKQTLYR
jgi:hypothetical protein